jgi:PBP1b-binding outer membrane lipoprotein LpoB
MKQIIIWCAFIMVSCSTYDDTYDSGADRQNAYQEERMEEYTEDTQNQNVDAPTSFKNQPF